MRKDQGQPGNRFPLAKQQNNREIHQTGETSLGKKAKLRETSRKKTEQNMEKPTWIKKKTKTKDML